MVQKFLDRLKKVPTAVAVVFALAGFLSAYIGSAYLRWVEKLYAENPGQIEQEQKCAHDCKAILTAGCQARCEEAAYKAWYERNNQLATYSHRELWIWELGFPVAMTIATIVCMGLGWLPKMRASQFLVGTLLLFLGSGVFTLVIVIALTVVLLWFVAPFAAAAIYAFWLSLVLNVMTERKQLLGLMLCIPVGLVLGWALHQLLPNFEWQSGAEVTWGLVFGASLAQPQTEAKPAR